MRVTLPIRLLVTLSLSLARQAGAAADPPLTPKSLAAKLSGPLHGDEGNKLASAVRTWFGEKNMANGPNPKIEGLDVAWAIEAPKASAPVVVSTDGSVHIPMVRLGNTDVFVATAAFPEGRGFQSDYLVDGKHLGNGTASRPRNAGAVEVYNVHPDSVEQTGVPKGKLTKQEPWKSKIFPNTTRDWWVYVPAQYKPEKPACVMIFQDGAGYIKAVPTVFDNLIAKGDMPVTVGVFINPGSQPGQRSHEYDTLSDQYPRFLLEEILPEVEKTVRLRHDAAGRAVAGISSGGICAFTCAWERPDEFSKVLSWVGSFTNIASGKTLKEGGHNYEAMLRKTDPPKPIRVFLQDGANDLDNNNGNWPLANQQMAKSLAFKGYDYKFVFGEGFHSPFHGRALLPDALRWLWRDEKP